MTFNNVAYGPGTFVRCDVCRDPEALQTPRHHSEAIFVPAAGQAVGSDEAERCALLSFGFVRRGWRLLCRGCALAAAQSQRLTERTGVPHHLPLQSSAGSHAGEYL